MDNPVNDPVVVVVDDEAVLRLHAADLLESAGYRVVEAADATTALTILEERQDVRLLFTDVQMPGPIDGMDLAREVHQRWPDVMLVVTSGDLDLHDSDIPDHGCFMSKPYRSGDLLGTVSRLIARR